MSSLEKLLYLRGVSAEYLNYSGERIVVPQELRLKYLEAVGYDVSNEEAVDRAVFELDALPWKSWLNPFNVSRMSEAEYVDIRVHPDEKSRPLSCVITTESGERHRALVIPGELPEVGEYYIDGVRYTAHRYPCPGLPLGYHQIELSTESRSALAQLVVVPRRCFEIDPERSQRPWGVSCQLYTLRSPRNWGVGDFTDLMELVAVSADAGMDVVGLNPLHALDMGGADIASPYSPSDRRFLNPLYIDPLKVPDLDWDKMLAGQLDSPLHRQKMVELRALPLVDYDAVAALKYPVYEALFQSFLNHQVQPLSARAKAFEEFVQRRGDALEAFSVHESLHSGLPYASARDPRFHQYLQWLAHCQLLQCQALALARGMSMGLMGDLAVGAVSGGAEVETEPGLTCKTATIGAPPDPFAPQGQNWNLPALDPIALQRDNYRHFIELLAANMAYFGALRIDHVMGLLRLWWCLPDVADGAYVYYPLEDLLAILRLESHRNQCLIIGEDMGVVPDELRARMTAIAVYSNKVFYFETTQELEFTPPQEHQADALLMVTNHDVATLAGWWNGADLRIRGEIGLLDRENELPDSRQQRQDAKKQLLAWLKTNGTLPATWGDGITDSQADKPFDIALCGAILATCARSRARIMLFQLDDLQLIEEPVNIPGTDREYPNWRRKQLRETQVLFAEPEIRALLASTNRERKR